jgi:hypothetical protein
MLYYKMKMFRKKQARRAKKAAPKPSKALTRAVTAIVKRNVETKTINVPSAVTPTSNNALVPYTALSGLQYLVQDVFKVSQGVQDSTAITASNRLGDKIRGIGFLMDYYITMPTFYTLSGTSFPIPFVKFRITAWKQAYGSPLLNQPLLYDSNFLVTNTATLQPINWDEGYVKEILYDKVFILRNNYVGFTPGGSFQVPPLSNVFHFRKYIKYDRPIKYVDNSSTSPNSTDNPVYVTLSAEIDESFSGLTPSGTNILFTTGYTRAWFKDA